MDINQILQIIAIIVLFSIVVHFIVKYLRKLIEYKFPNVKNIFLWKEMALPVLPPLIGAGLTFIPGYPYPEILINFAGKLFFGIFCGLFSGLIYRVTKKSIEKILTKSIDKIGN